MNARELLIDPFAYIAPLASVDGLSEEEATRRFAGAPHTIAEIVAHLSHWQEWFAGRARGSGVAMAERAALGWPGAEEGWPTVRERFETGLRDLATLHDMREGDVTPALEFPPLAHYTVGDVLVHVAQHNAHHLGQVVLLRQVMGLWPPPAGSWTW